MFYYQTNTVAPTSTFDSRGLMAAHGSVRTRRPAANMVMEWPGGWLMI
jgi:hypothetical protein